MTTVKDIKLLDSGPRISNHLTVRDHQKSPNSDYGSKRHPGSTPNKKRGLYDLDELDDFGMEDINSGVSQPLNLDDFEDYDEDSEANSSIQFEEPEESEIQKQGLDEIFGGESIDLQPPFSSPSPVNPGKTDENRKINNLSNFKADEINRFNEESESDSKDYFPTRREVKEAKRLRDLEKKYKKKYLQKSGKNEETGAYGWPNRNQRGERILEKAPNSPGLDIQSEKSKEIEIGLNYSSNSNNSIKPSPTHSYEAIINNIENQIHRKQARDSRNRKRLFSAENPKPEKSPNNNQKSARSGSQKPQDNSLDLPRGSPRAKDAANYLERLRNGYQPVNNSTGNFLTNNASEHPGGLQSHSGNQQSSRLTHTPSVIANYKHLEANYDQVELQNRLKLETFKKNTAKLQKKMVDLDDKMNKNELLDLEIKDIKDEIEKVEFEIKDTRERSKSRSRAGSSRRLPLPADQTKNGRNAKNGKDGEFILSGRTNVDLYRIIQKKDSEIEKFKLAYEDLMKKWEHSVLVGKKKEKEFTNGDGNRSLTSAWDQLKRGGGGVDNGDEEGDENDASGLGRRGRRLGLGYKRQSSVTAGVEGFGGSSALSKYSRKYSSVERARHAGKGGSEVPASVPTKKLLDVSTGRKDQSHSGLLGAGGSHIDNSKKMGLKDNGAQSEYYTSSLTKLGAGGRANQTEKKGGYQSQSQLNPRRQSIGGNGRVFAGRPPTPSDRKKRPKPPAINVLPPDGDDVSLQLQRRPITQFMGSPKTEESPKEQKIENRENQDFGEEYGGRRAKDDGRRTPGYKSKRRPKRSTSYVDRYLENIKSERKKFSKAQEQNMDESVRSIIQDSKEQSKDYYYNRVRESSRRIEDLLVGKKSDILGKDYAKIDSYKQEESAPSRHESQILDSGLSSNIFSQKTYNFKAIPDSSRTSRNPKYELNLQNLMGYASKTYQNTRNGPSSSKIKKEIPGEFYDKNIGSQALRSYKARYLDQKKSSGYLPDTFESGYEKFKNLEQKRSSYTNLGPREASGGLGGRDKGPLVDYAASLRKNQSYKYLKYGADLGKYQARNDAIPASSATVQRPSVESSFSKYENIPKSKYLTNSLQPFKIGRNDAPGISSNHNTYNKYQLGGSRAPYKPRNAYDQKIDLKDHNYYTGRKNTYKRTGGSAKALQNIYGEMKTSGDDYFSSKGLFNSTTSSKGYGLSGDHRGGRGSNEIDLGSRRFSYGSGAGYGGVGTRSGLDLNSRLSHLRDSAFKR